MQFAPMANDCCDLRIGASKLWLWLRLIPGNSWAFLALTMSLELKPSSKRLPHPLTTLTKFHSMQKRSLLTTARRIRET